MSSSAFLFHNMQDVLLVLKILLWLHKGTLGVISHGNLHEINTWRFPTQTVWLSRHLV